MDNTEYENNNDMMVLFSDNYTVSFIENEVNNIELLNDNEIENEYKSIFKILKKFEETDDFEFNREKLKTSKSPTQKFELISNEEMCNSKGAYRKKFTFENLICDFKDIYTNPDSCVVQIETNLDFKLNELNKKNLFKNYKNSQMLYTPEDTIYIIYKTNHDDILKNFFEYIKKNDNTINYKIQNGHLLFDTEQDLIKTNQVLKLDMTRRREARQKLITLYQKSCNCYIDGDKFKKDVAQIYCYVPSIKSNNYNPNLWKGLNELFLEAMYENAIYISNLKGVSKCYLIPLGEEQDISSKQIARAIQRACNIASLKNINLDVKLIHKKEWDNEYAKIEKNYPIKNVNINSIWETHFEY